MGLGAFCAGFVTFHSFFFNASILQASWSPTTTQESDVYTLKTRGGEAELSQPRVGEEEPRAWLHQHGNKQEHSVRCEHLIHTHSTFWIHCPGKGEASGKHWDGRGCACPQSSSRWPLTSRLCWPQLSGAGRPRGNTVAEGDTRSSADPGQPTGKGGASLNGPKLRAREGTAWHAQDLPHLRVTPPTLPVPSSSPSPG